MIERKKRILQIQGALIEGKFIERTNRFIIIAKINGEGMRCHLHDPGRSKEILIPGARLLIRPVKGKRKMNYDAIAVMANDGWVPIDSGMHNILAMKMLERHI